MQRTGGNGVLCFVSRWAPATDMLPKPLRRIYSGSTFYRRQFLARRVDRGRGSRGSVPQYFGVG